MCRDSPRRGKIGVEKISTSSSYSSIFRFETIYRVTSVKRKETFTPGIEYMGIFEKTKFHFRKTSHNSFALKKKPPLEANIAIPTLTDNSRFYRWKKINQPSLLVKENKKKKKNFEHASTACSTLLPPPSPPPLNVNTDGVERRFPVYPRTCRIITSGKRAGE